MYIENRGKNMNVEILEINKEPDIIELFGEDLTSKKFITNPAIARDSEIKKVILTLLTPEKSAILVGKPGIGKTAIVEGIAYLIQKNEVPKAIEGYRVIKFNSSSLSGIINLEDREEAVISLLIKQLKKKEKVIIFIDEIHTLIGNNNSLDLANVLKPALDRGDVKAIGATTTIEYDKYIIRDRAFLRRFEKVEVLEPSRDTTVDILVGSLPRIEKSTGIKFKYNQYISRLIIESIVDATSEYKRIYGLAAMYPDVSFSILTQSFSQALFENRKEVTVKDVYNAIRGSKRLYPDSIVKELILFKEKFKEIIDEEQLYLEDVKVEELKKENEGLY
jgi:ATP-dependent Clp protease ATP-binding subunit ClpA